MNSHIDYINENNDITYLLTTLYNKANGNGLYKGFTESQYLQYNSSGLLIGMNTYIVYSELKNNNFFTSDNISEEGIKITFFHEYGDE